MKYDPNIFQIYESVDADESVIATYLIGGRTSDLLTKVGSMAIEQTTGTWRPVPLETPEVRRRHGGKVIGVYEIPNYEFNMPEAEGKERWAVCTDCISTRKFWTKSRGVSVDNHWQYIVCR